MTSSIAATVASSDHYVLGEGPFWDGTRDRLLWVDIARGTVIAGRLDHDRSIRATEQFTLPETVGAVAPARDGTLLVAGAERLYRRALDGGLQAGPRLLPAGRQRRLNDGKPDPTGAFVVGSLSLGGQSSNETLMRVDGDGRVRVLDDDLTLSNGLAWTADGRILYSVDTLSQTVYARNFDPFTGEVGMRRTVVRLELGFPDGMCLDAEEHLWVAVWGQGEVHRYSPHGELEQIVTVPAPHVSSVAFAGPMLETLVITTAREGLSTGQLAARPLSGHLFTTEPGVLGLPQPQWDGTFTPENE